MERENKKTKILKNENKKLLEENETIRRFNSFLIETNNNISRDNKNLIIENSRLKVFELNIKSDIRQYLLILKDKKKYYEYSKEDLVVADLNKIINFLERWIR